MRTTIDKAGRIVIPRQLREQIGLTPGQVDVHVVGNAIQIAVPEAEAPLREDEHGFLVIDGAGPFVDDEALRDFRLAPQLDRPASE